MASQAFEDVLDQKPLIAPALDGDKMVHSGMADPNEYTILPITTLDYGDFNPVTAGGRITGIFIIFLVVGIIDALASVLPVCWSDFPRTRFITTSSACG